jgi:hypothetical protein
MTTSQVLILKILKQLRFLCPLAEPDHQLANQSYRDPPGRLDCVALLGVVPELICVSVFDREVPKTPGRKHRVSKGQAASLNSSS